MKAILKDYMYLLKKIQGFVHNVILIGLYLVVVYSIGFAIMEVFNGISHQWPLRVILERMSSHLGYIVIGYGIYKLSDFIRIKLRKYNLQELEENNEGTR